MRAFERLETWFLTKAPGHKDGRLLSKSPPPGRLSCVELLSGGRWSPAGGLSAQGTGKPIKRPEGKTSERPAEEGEVGGLFHNSISLPHTFGTRTKATPENPRRRPHKVPLVLSSSSRVGREGPERSIVNSVDGGHSPAHRRERVGGGERAERDEARRDRFRRRRETGQIPSPLSQPIGYILFRLDSVPPSAGGRSTKKEICGSPLLSKLGSALLKAGSGQSRSCSWAMHGLESTHNQIVALG